MGNLFGGKSAKRAAAATQATANQGANDILATNQANTALMQPNVDFANKAMTPLGGLLGLQGYDTQSQNDALTNDAGYQFGLNQAQRNMDGSAGARGLLMSGANMLGQADLGNRYATDARQNAINNFMNLYNTGNGLLGNIAGNNNSAAANAAQMRVGGAQQYAQQRAQNYQNNFGIMQQLISNAQQAAAAAAGGSGGGAPASSGGY